MAFMFNDNKSFAKHIQQSGIKAEDGIKDILKEFEIPHYRPKGIGLKIDYIIPTNINLGVEVKYQEDGQTAYEKVPHAVYKYVFHNPIKLDELWILLLGKGWRQILKSPSGKRILEHIELIQNNTDIDIVVIDNISKFINKLEGIEEKEHEFF